MRDLIEKVCQRNERLARFFGYKKISLQIKHNKRTRNVYDMLLNDPNIIKIGEKPTILQWLSDPSDPSDLNNINKKEKSGEIQEINYDSYSEPGSLRSLRSPREEEQEVQESNTDRILLLKTNSDLKSRSIEMTKEQYDSWAHEN